MFIEQEHDLTITLSWLGGKTDVGTIVVPSSTLVYYCQTAKKPDKEEISVISTLPNYEFQFLDQSYYLSHWLDGYFSLLDVSSKPAQPYLETFETTLQDPPEEAAAAAECTQPTK